MLKEIYNQAVPDSRLKTVETVDSKAGPGVNRKKQNRGRVNSTSGRGRGSRINDTKPIISPVTISSSNGQLENSLKVRCLYYF